MGLHVEKTMLNHTSEQTLTTTVDTKGEPLYVIGNMSGMTTNGTSFFQVPLSTENFVLHINGSDGHSDIEMDHFNFALNAFSITYNGNWSGYRMTCYVEYVVA